MKSVLLTGAGGFIGRHCIPILLEKGYIVHAVTSKNIHSINESQLYWHHIDLLNHKNIEFIVQKVNPTHLLHFAWYTENGFFWHSSHNIDWLTSSLKLLKEFKAIEGKRIVISGTCAEYDWNHGYCKENITPLVPSTLYGVSKNALQKILHQYTQQNDISYAWGRIFFLYGPFEHENRLIPYVIKSLINGKPAECTHGEQVRDFLHVEDVANAFVELLDSDLEGPINIASGVPVTIKQVVKKIGTLLQKQDFIQLGMKKCLKYEPPLILADVSRLKTELRWNPKYDLENGLQATINWQKKNNKVSQR